MSECLSSLATVGALAGHALATLLPEVLHRPVVAEVVGTQLQDGFQAGSLSRAAAKAGCTVRSFPNFGREHTTKRVRYRTNPPTSGPHNPVPAEDGIYDDPPPTEKLVQALRHVESRAYDPPRGTRDEVAAKLERKERVSTRRISDPSELRARQFQPKPILDPEFLE